MAKKNEAYVEFKANTAEFNKGIKDMNAELKNASNALRLNSTQLKGAGDSVDLLSERQDILQNELEASNKKVELTEKSLAECKATLGENSKEYQNLSNAVLAAKNQQAAIQNELDQTAAKLDKITQENKEAATSFGKLADTIEEQEGDLEALKKEYTELVLTQGKNSKEAKDLAKQISSLSGELADNKKKMSDAEGAADKLDKSLDKLDDSAKDAGDGFTVLKGAAASLVADGFNAAISGVGEVVDAFNEVDEGADNAVKATGATGKAAEELGESYKKVAASVVGDFGDIGSTLGEVNTRFGYTGEKLEKCTEDFLKFAEVTGTDSTDAVQSVTRAMNDAGIPLDEYGSLLDQLAKAGQAAGIDVTTLADSLSKNGATMRAMGFDTEETIALLSQFELSGADTATMLAGMKKAMANWADEGKNGNTEFAKLVEGVKNGSVTASGAIDVFGAKAGPQLVDAIKSGKFEYNDMLKVVQDSKGTMSGTFDDLVDGGYKAELATQNAKLAMADVGETVLETVSPAFDDITSILSTMADNFQKAVEWGTQHKGVLATIATVIGVITTAIVAYNAVQAIKTAMDAAQVTTVWALVAAHAAQAAAAIAALAPYLAIVAAIAAVIAIIVLCVKHWDTIKEKITEVAQKVKEKVTQIKEQITEKLTAAKDKALSVVENLKSGFTSKVEAIKSKVSSVFSSIKEKIMTPINSARDKVKAAVDKIKSFFNFKITLPKIKTPKVAVTWKTDGALAEAAKYIGLKGIPKFSVKWNALGGFFNKPTVLQGLGEAGPEYALPLNERSLAPLATMLNKLTLHGENGLADILASRFDAAVNKLADRLERLELAVYLDSERVATATAPHNDIRSAERALLAERGLALK